MDENLLNMRKYGLFICISEKNARAMFTQKALKWG